MGKRAPKPLPPPTEEERRIAGEAAKALRAVAAGEAPAGLPQMMHVDYSRPRRSAWITTWPGLPGFSRINRRFRHACLAGWEYAKEEVRTEMIPDLEALAERGERPTEATND